jgi:PAS domain S-box-containing protein
LEVLIAMDQMGTLPRIFEGAKGGVFKASLKGELTMVSDTLARMYGYATTAGMLKAQKNIVAQMFADPVEGRRFLKQLLARGMVEGYECLQLKVDKSTFWASLHARLVRDHEEKPASLEGWVFDIHTRKEADEALRASEMRYQMLVEQIPAAVYIDLPGASMKTIYMSPQIISMIGYTPEEWMGNPGFWLKIMHPDDRQRARAEYLQAMKSANQYDLEYRLIARNGQTVWCRDVAMLVPGVERHTRVWQGVLLDISERKQSDAVQSVIAEIARATISTKTLEELYRIIHRALRTVITAENFYIALYDPEKDLLSFPYFVDPYDEPPLPQKPGHGLTEYILHHRKPMLASPAVFADLLKAGEVEEVGPESIDWLGVPLIFGERIIGVMAVQSYAEVTRYGPRERDIMSLVSAQIALAIERKRTETSLQESELRYRELIEFSPEAIAVHQAGRVVYGNPAALRLMGVKKLSDAVGRSLLDFVHPDFRKVVSERVQKGLTSTGPLPLLEEKFLRTDGTSLDVEVVSMPFTFNGEPAVQVIFRDISERKKNERSLQHQLRELVVLQAVAKATAEESVIDRLMQRVTDILVGILYPDKCGVVLYNKKDGTWLPHSTYFSKEEYLITEPVPISRGIVGRTISSGRSQRVGDVSRSPYYILGTAGVHSEICVPIRIHRAIFGAINAESVQPDAFSEEDERLLTTIAGNLATAIEKIQLLHTERQRRREAETLQKAAAGISSTLDQEQVINLILDELAKVVPHTSASVQFLKEGYLEIVGGRGWPDAASVLGLHVPIPADNPNSIVMEKRHAVIVRDAQAEYLTFRQPPHNVIHSWLGVPLLARRRLIGMLAIDHTQKDFFTEEHARLVRAFATQASLALENTRLFDETKKRVQELDAVARISQLLGRTFGLNDLLANILKTTCQIIPGAEKGSILLLDEQHKLRIRAVYGYVDPRIRESIFPSDFGFTGMAIREKRTVLISDALTKVFYKYPIKIREMAEVKSAVVAPLLVKNVAIGAISIDNVTRKNAFSDSDRNLLTAISGPAAIAIENARLFEDLQRSNLELSRAYDTTLAGWGRALEMRDKETRGHTNRVTRLTLQLAQLMGCSGEELVHIRRGCLLHDIGKMGIPDNILKKEGALTKEEWKVMKKHSFYAYEFLQPIEYLRPSLDIPYYHHEHWDGTGYPRGLKSEEIPLSARIFAVADVWDALLHNRPYRRAWERPAARKYLRQQSGRQFDPQIIRIFLDSRLASD